jgi:U-box domain
LLGNWKFAIPIDRFTEPVGKANQSNRKKKICERMQNYLLQRVQRTLASGQPKLKCRNRGLDDDAVIELCPHLENNVVLVSLDLAQNEFGARGMHALANVLPTMTSLEHLDLMCNKNFDTEAIDVLCAVLPQCPSLRRLYLPVNTSFFDPIVQVLPQCNIVDMTPFMTGTMSNRRRRCILAESLASNRSRLAQSQQASSSSTVNDEQREEEQVMLQLVDHKKRVERAQQVLAECEREVNAQRTSIDVAMRLHVLRARRQMHNAMASATHAGADRDARVAQLDALFDQLDNVADQHRASLHVAQSALDSIQESVDTAEALIEMMSIDEAMLGDDAMHKQLENALAAADSDVSSLEQSKQPAASSSSSGIDRNRESVMESDMVCPITLEPFVDPVLAPDSFTYERVAIEQWLEVHKTSPMTREPMSKHKLISNRLAKQRCF